MSHPEARPHHTVLIPWIITLIALFGMNALVRDHSRLCRSEKSDGVGLSQFADDVCPIVRPSDPMVFLTDTLDVTGLRLAGAKLVCIETRHNLPEMRALEGAAQGRAPPVAALA